MADRVTIQDIADALGVSRNTVSKAINNTGILAEATRERVLRKAVEMGYKQFSYVSLPDVGTPAGAGTQSSPAPGSGRLSVSLPEASESLPRRNGVISMLTTQNLGNSHFSSTMLDRFQRGLTEAGYSFMMHRVTEENLSRKELPATFHPELTDGILCIEMFDSSYSEMICGLGIPTLFVDAPAAFYSRRLASDLLLMDNKTEILTFIREMVARGKKTFGFIGETGHCISFHERFAAMREGLFEAGLAFEPAYCISSYEEIALYPDSFTYQDYLSHQLEQMKRLPEVFVCANDFVAMDTLIAFRKLGIRVPEDVMLCGFDNSPESRVMVPTLTSVHIHSQIMGIAAVNLLLSRIQEPSLHYRTVYTETTLIYRESTGN